MCIMLGSEKIGLSCKGYQQVQAFIYLQNYVQAEVIFTHDLVVQVPTLLKLATRN
jgi:hypothetical protein